MLPAQLASAEMKLTRRLAWQGLSAAAKGYSSNRSETQEELMALSCATAEDVLKSIKDEKVQMIDLRFTDLPGVWQHFSVPPSAIDADALEEGIGFDGSSIRGFQEIQENDMLGVPDPTTAFVDPYSSRTTLVL